MNHDDLGNYTHSYVKQQIDEAYRKGQEHMRDRCIDRLGDYEANKCAQIVAGVEVREGGETFLATYPYTQYIVPKEEK